MPRDDDLPPAEYAALAFLAAEPAHGYELARRWTASPVIEVCPAEQSVVYGYLRHLERAALLDWSELQVGNRPVRRVYEVNEDGWSVLRAWLHAPVHRMREVRSGFLLKLFFLGEIDPRAVPALIRAQVAICEAYIAEARERRDRTADFEQLVATSRLTAGEATLAWLATLSAPEDGERAAS